MLSDDELRQTYNRAVAATDKPYPEAYLEGLRALVAAGWDEGARRISPSSTWDELFHVPENPYRG